MTFLQEIFDSIKNNDIINYIIGTLLGGGAGYGATKLTKTPFGKFKEQIAVKVEDLENSVTTIQQELKINTMQDAQLREDIEKSVKSIDDKFKSIEKKQEDFYNKLWDLLKNKITE